ncbi:MAG: hypothetical protein OEL50_00275 [Rhodospirillaceae bacterium]|nr:hypothetical protein [Rhodospirillaceae bacterium]
MPSAHKSLRERACEATKRINTILGIVDESHDKEVAQAVEKAIIDALLEERERCATVAFECCAEDKDKAHKVADEVRRIRNALVTNLTSMR